MNTGTTSLFLLQIDPAGGGYLRETARWAKFLAIVGFVFCGLIVLFGLFFSTIMGSFMRQAGTSGLGSAGMGAISILYVLIAAVYFFPCLYLYRFGTKTQAALAMQDQVTLNESLGNLKSAFKFVGVLTLVLLAIYGLLFAVGLLAGGFAAFMR